MIIRKATDADYDQLLTIWLNGVNETFAGITITEEMQYKFRKNFEERSDWQFWVIEKDESLVGFQSFLPFSNNPMRRTIFESSTYIEKSHINNGHGFRLLVKSLDGIDNCKADGVIAFVKPSNSAAVKMVPKLGFIQIGMMPLVGNSGERLIFLKAIK